MSPKAGAAKGFTLGRKAQRHKLAIVAVAGAVVLGTSLPARANHRWYGIGRENVAENGSPTYSGGRHKIYHATIGSTGSSATVKINCYDFHGDPNTVFMNVWGAWTVGSSWIETYAKYQCGAGESRTRVVGAQAWWAGIPRWNVEHGPFSDTAQHDYAVVHDHERNPDCQGLVVPGYLAWYVAFDSVQWGPCMTWLASAPHIVAIDSGIEITNDDGTIKVNHHAYDSVRYRTAHGAGSWIDADLDYKTRNYPPVGAHWPAAGGVDNQTHACVYGASSTCH